MKQQTFMNTPCACPDCLTTDFPEWFEYYGLDYYESWIELSLPLTLIRYIRGPSRVTPQTPAPF